MKTKKILALCLCLVMLFQLIVPMTVQAATPTSGTFGYDSEGNPGALTWSYSAPKLTISLTSGFTNGAMDDYPDDKDLALKQIPWKDYRTKITTVDVQEGVTSIGVRAFTHHTRIYAINLPETLEKVGAKAFYSCTSLEEAILLQNVTEIGAGAFQQCTKLVGVSIPVDVTTIPEAAFSNCNALKNIYYSGSEAEWGAITIEGSNGPVPKAEILYNAEGGVKYIFDEATGVLTLRGYGMTKTFTGYSSTPHYLGGYRTKVTSIVVEEGVTGLGAFSLYNLSSATSIQLPSTLLFIGNNAMQLCKKITVIDVPAKVKRILNRAFYECTALETLILPGNLTQFQNRVLYKSDNIKYIKFNGDRVQYNTFLYGGKADTLGYARIDETTGDYMNPDDRIGNTQLNDAIDAGSIEILLRGCEGVRVDNVLTITGDGKNLMSNYTSSEGQRAPWYTTDNVANTTKIIVGNGVLNLGHFAFYKFNKVTEIEINAPITTVGNNVFYDCQKLQSITFPQGTESLGTTVFYKCYALNSLYLPKSLKTVHVNLFSGILKSGVNNLKDIYYEGTEEEWKKIGNISSAITDAKLPGVTIHYNYEYPTPEEPEEPEEPVVTGWEYADGVLTVTENIADFAEGTAPWNKYAAEITSVVIDTAVTALPTYAFAGLNIASVVIPEDVTVIPAGAFKDCASLTNITAPAGITAVGADALAGCTALTTIYYDGTEEEFANISIDDSNLPVLANVDLVYTGKPGGGIELPDFDF